MMYVVVTDTDAPDVFGPFDDEDKARAWACEACGPQSDWVVAKVEVPADSNKGAA